MAATDSRVASDGLERFGDADLNNDGQITRAEWLSASANGFAALDRSRDGKLVFSELPLGPRHGGPHPRPHDDPERLTGPAPVPAAAANATDAG